MFETIKNKFAIAKFMPATRLSRTVAGCATGIFFAAKNVFRIPFEKLVQGKIPVWTTFLASAGVLLFKVKKNLSEDKLDEAHSVKITFSYLKSQRSHSSILRQLELDQALLNTSQSDAAEIKAILIEIYHRLDRNNHSFEKYAASSFWAAVQFISHFSEEMLSLAFCQTSLYGMDSNDVISTQNLIFGSVLLLAIYNSVQAFTEELNRYEPSIADLHFTLVNAFTPKAHVDYGSLQEGECPYLNGFRRESV